MANTFDGISEPIPANYEFAFEPNRNSKLQIWLNDTFHRSSRKFRRLGSDYFWKVFFIGTVFWLSLGIPMFMIWQEVKEFKSEITGNNGGSRSTNVGKGNEGILGEDALQMVVYEDFMESSTDGYAWEENELSSSPSYISSSEPSPPTTGNPWKGYCEQLINEKFDGFQSKWEECRCPPGEVGPPGLPGPPGISMKGDKGAQGEMGLQGPKGDRGERGMRGETGMPGQPGISGVPGRNGDRGQKGDMGMRGYQGPQGYPGQKGDRSMWG